MSAKIIGILMLFCISLMSCHEDLVKYFLREGRTLSLLESEFGLQLDILNRSFKARDSASFVKAVFKDTIQTSIDTIIVNFDYVQFYRMGRNFRSLHPGKEYLTM